MSSPGTAPDSPDLVSVHPEAVTALGAELAVLAAELADDAELSRSAAASIPVALGGHEGWSAGAAATAWASLGTVLADRTGVMAGALVAAAASYRAQDDALAADIDADSEAGLAGTPSVQVPR